MSRMEIIQRHISAASVDLREAQREHAQIVLALGEDPTNTEAQARLKALESEIEKLQRRIRRLETRMARRREAIPPGELTVYLPPSDIGPILLSHVSAHRARGGGSSRTS